MHKKTCCAHTVTYQFANGLDYKDTSVIHVPVQEGQTCATIEQIWTHVQSIYYLDKNKVKFVMAAMRIGDKLPLRHYLLTTKELSKVYRTTKNYVLDPKLFQLWMFEDSLNDGRTQNWFALPYPDYIPRIGFAHYSILLKAFQPEHKKTLIQISKTFQPDAYGRFKWNEAKEHAQAETMFLHSCISQKLIGILQEYSHNQWIPPVRTASQFGRTYTNSCAYVPRNRQTKIRLALHTDFFVFDDDPCVKQKKLQIGDHVDEDITSNDPDDFVVS